MLRDFTDAVLALLERHLALRLDQAWVDVAVAGSVLFLVLLSLLTAFLRLSAAWRKGRQTLERVDAAADVTPQVTPQEATARAVTAATSPVNPRAPETPPRQPPQPTKERATRPSVSPPSSRMPPPQMREPTTTASGGDRVPTPAPAAPSPEPARPRPALTVQQRKDLALALRDAVLAKIAEGGWFKDGADPLTYRFNRVSLTRMQFEILMELPSPGGAPRSTHALHITVDGRKKLNLEWGGAKADAAARVRFLSPGDWTAAITSWNFADNRPPLVTPQPARKRA